MNATPANFDELRQTLLATLQDPRRFVLVWLTSAILPLGIAIVVRRAQHRPFFKPTFAGATLEETWCSGLSSAGLLGAFGTARNCLWVVVTPATLHVGLHFPFNLLLPRFLSGLEVTIPRTAISSIESLPSSLLKGEQVRVTYIVRDDGRGTTRSETLTLQPRRPDGLLRALRQDDR